MKESNDWLCALETMGKILIKGNKWKSATATATAIGAMFVVMLLLSVMPAIGAEGSNSESPHFDRWVGQRDMSNFSRYSPPIEKKAVPNETSEILYPGLIVWNSSRILKEDISPFLTPPSTLQVDQANIENVTEQLTQYRRMVGIEDDKAAAYIKDKMEEYGLDTHLEAFSFETTTAGRGKHAGNIINITTSNVIGIKEGACDQIIIVGAHYDTSCPDCPGADDNAGGVAVMLEVARELQNESFNRTIYFIAFSGEEFGLLGSKSWLEKHEDLRDNIVAMINLDCVAYGDKLLMSSPSRWLLDVFPPKASIDKREGIAPFASDEWRFLEENLPFVRLCDLGSHIFWDTPNDTIAILNFSLAKDCAEIIAAGVYNLAATNDLTPPEVSVEVENGTIYYDPSERSTIQILVDGMNLGYIESGKLSLPAGAHHVKVMAMDDVGNRAYDEQIVNISHGNYEIPTFEGESVVIIPWKRPDKEKRVLEPGAAEPVLKWVFKPSWIHLHVILDYELEKVANNVTVTGFLDGIRIEDLDSRHFVVLSSGKHDFKVAAFDESGKIVGFDEDTFSNRKSYDEPPSYPSHEEEPNIAIPLTIAVILVIAAISFLVVRKVRK